MNAAPIIECDRSTMPAPAYTDNVSIFVDRDFSGEERRLAVKHEQCHIWLWHFNRRAKAERKYGESFDYELWVLAQELEIARLIYTEEDLIVINRPRSRLAGGVVPTSYGVPVDIDICEEIYEYLVANPPKNTNKCGCCQVPPVPNEDAAESAPEDVTDLLKEVAAAAEELSDKLEARDAAIQAQHVLKSSMTALRKPSLLGEIDSALRSRVTSEQTYRRPSRRPAMEGQLLRGRISILRPPLLVVYVDRSGSFDYSKTAQATDLMQKIISRYGASIRHDTYYFGGGRLTQEDPKVGGGNTPYELVVERINAERAVLSIVITDDDPCNSIKIDKGLNCVVVPCGSQTTKFASATGAKEVRSL